MRYQWVLRNQNSKLVFITLAALILNSCGILSKRAEEHKKAHAEQATAHEAKRAEEKLVRNAALPNGTPLLFAFDRQGDLQIVVPGLVKLISSPIVFLSFF